MRYLSESEDSGTCLSRGDSLRVPSSGLKNVEPTRVKIEVSGVQFLISEKKLDRWPRTLLGNPDDRLKYKDCTRNMYIFDSNASKIPPKKRTVDLIATVRSLVTWFG